MSLSSILSHINKKGQVQKRSVDSNNSTVSNGKPAPRTDGSSMNAVTGIKPVDPVVAMLKEKRRLERKKKEQELREKKGLPPTKPKSSTKSSTTKMASKTTTNSKGPSSKPPLPINQGQRITTKKLNFNELIKKASKIDNSKLSISIRPKTKSPEAINNSNIQKKPINQIKKSTNISQPASEISRHTINTVKPTKNIQPVKRIPDNLIKNRAPIPIRKPSAQLEAKLKNKVSTAKHGRDNMHKYSYSSSYEYEEEDSSFIVSDDEFIENEPADYDRDEIWAMFNKGKKRSYFDRYDDYDSDDMEATGNEIFEEEMRSKRRAELEDRKEQEMERKLQEQKKARKLKRI